MPKTITKVYTLEDNVDCVTCCGVSHDTDGDLEGCNNEALYTITIKTTSLSGRIITSRMPLCDRHISTKYSKWFKLGRFE